MATFEEVKNTIDEQIADNGQGKITGGVLNGVLHDMVGATEDALNEKAKTTYVDERLTDVEQGVLAYVDTQTNNKVGKVEEGGIVYASAQGLRDTDGDEYYDYVLPSSPRPQHAHYVLATTNDIDIAIANAIKNTLNTAV